MSRRTRTNRSRPIDQDVTAWVVKVGNAGDSVPASALVANREFVKRCRVGGFWSAKMRNGVVFTFSANTLTGAIVSYGSFTSTNNNLTTSDYSLSTGITPNGNLTTGGSNKYINSGFNPAINLSNSNSAQLSYYSRTDLDNASYPPAISAYDAVSNRWLMHLRGGGSQYYDCYSATSPVDRVAATVSNSLGLISGSRTASNDLRSYQNGSQVGSTVTTAVSSSRPNFSTIIFGGNSASAGGVSFGAESRTCAYAYIGDGLTPSEEFQHYQAVQQMQMRLGRAV